MSASTGCGWREAVAKWANEHKLQVTVDATRDRLLISRSNDFKKPYMAVASAAPGYHGPGIWIYGRKPKEAPMMLLGALLALYDRPPLLLAILNKCLPVLDVQPRVTRMKLCLRLCEEALPALIATHRATDPLLENLIRQRLVHVDSISGFKRTVTVPC